MSTRTHLADHPALTAILAGARTKAQIADQLGIDLTPIRDYRDPAELIRYAPAQALSIVLRRLVCADLLCMKVVDAQCHYIATRKARETVERGA